MPKAKSWEEYKVECQAVAKPGITVLGYVGEWKGSKTKLLCKCEKHGEWDTTNIGHFKQGKGCPECGIHRTKESRSIPDSVHINEFMNTGAFHVGTLFTRNTERVNSNGWCVYWNYICPICSNDEYAKAGLCSGVFTSTMSSLKEGKLSCRCATNCHYTKEQWEYRLTSICHERGYIFKGWKGKKWGSLCKFKYICPHHGEQYTSPFSFISKGSGCPECGNHNQQQCYINLVRDDNNTPVALKIGIAKDSNARVKWQNNKNTFQMSQMSVYEFHTVQDCKDAEKACLTELKCGILNERELKDGYTETTSILNYNAVVSIYKRFGGVKVS